MNDDICCLIVGYVYKSQQNGQVYDPRGVSPTICVGHHAGVEPRIIVYEDICEYPSVKPQDGVEMQAE